MSQFIPSVNLSLSLSLSLSVSLSLLQIKCNTFFYSKLEMYNGISICKVEAKSTRTLFQLQKNEIETLSHKEMKACELYNVRGIYVK